MKKTLVMLLCSAVILLSTMQNEASAQLSPVTPPVVTPPVVTPPVVTPPVIVIKGNKGTLTHGDKVKLKSRSRGRGKWLGGSPANPFMPFRTIRLGGGRTLFVIQFLVKFPSVINWIDPEIAIGYDYSVEKGPRVTAIELPEGIGDNKFNLWVHESGKYVDSGVEIEGGTMYKFNEPISKFSIRGIETSAKLDSESEIAFPTGLSFEKTGKAVVNMTSVTKEI